MKADTHNPSDGVPANPAKPAESSGQPAMAEGFDESMDTPDRLLVAAAEVFAEKGYHESTLAEICRRAGANGAAVNYYFRSKDNLYRKAWRRAFERSLAAHPIDGGLGANPTPEQRLEAMIHAMVARIADPRSCEFDIVRHEHGSPTGLLQEIMRESIEPLRRYLAGIVRELLGPAVDETDVQLCQRSTMAQCLHMMMLKRAGSRHVGPPPLELPNETVADHVVRFSLAGMAEARRRAGAEDKGDPRETS
jgi:AcrR family transcriptional regulator